MATSTTTGGDLPTDESNNLPTHTAQSQAAGAPASESNPTVTNTLVQSFLVQSNVYPSYPNGTFAYWTQWCNAAPQVGIMLVNNGSGPGHAQDPNLIQGIARAHAHAIKVVGYVHTGYGTRPLAQIQGEIDSWYGWYQVDGIHLDNVNAFPQNFAFYQTLYHYIKAKDATRNLVVMNSGQAVEESYMKISDIISLYENDYAHFTAKSGPHTWAGDTGAPWVKNYPAKKFWAVVFNIPDIPSMQRVVQAMKAANMGWINVTDQLYPNEYAAPPSPAFWSAALAAAKGGK